MEQSGRLVARCEIPQVPIPAGSHTHHQNAHALIPLRVIGQPRVRARISRSIDEYVTAMTTVAVTASTSAKLANSRLQVSTSETLGRGLLVIQDIPAGSLLFRTNPLISVLDDSLLEKACSTCFSISKTVDSSVGKELFKCTGCNLIHYCSKVPPPGSLLMADMSAERLEGPSFKRVQVFTIEQEHSTGFA